MGQRQQRGLQPTKWQVYEQILRIPYYILFDRYTDELQVFELVCDRYQSQVLVEPRFWLPKVGLGIGLWQGEYQGLYRPWLRWYDANGNWILMQVEQERLRAERLAERLRQEGIDPEEI